MSLDIPFNRTISHYRIIMGKARVVVTFDGVLLQCAFSLAGRLRQGLSQLLTKHLE